MQKVLYSPFSFLLIFLFSAAIPKAPIEGPVFVLNQQMPNYTFTDQFGESHTMDAQTEHLIVALDKEAAHAVNDFLAKQDPSYLAEHHMHLIVDVSAAPGIIQKMFILPGLKDFEYPVLIFRDEAEAAPFRMEVNPEKLLSVSLKNRKITALKEYEATEAGVESMMKSMN